MSAAIPAQFLIFLHTLSLVLEESVDLGDGSVKGNDSETMVGSIQDQVLAHNGQTDETKITTRFIMRSETGSDASQTRSMSANDSQRQLLAAKMLELLTRSRSSGKVGYIEIRLCTYTGSDMIAVLTGLFLKEGSRSK